MYQNFATIIHMNMMFKVDMQLQWYCTCCIAKGMDQWQKVRENISMTQLLQASTKTFATLYWLLIIVKHVYNKH